MPLKIVNRTPFATKGKFDMVSKLKAQNAYGAEWFAEVEAHPGIVDRLNKNLNDRFTLLQNIVLPDLDYPIPFILIGPNGIRVLYVSPTTGLFEATGDEWQAFDKRTQLYRPATPNLLRRTLLFSKAVEAFVRNKGKETPFLDPVVIFSNPGVDIDTKEPIVKVVRVDALPRFIPTLNAGSATLTTVETDSLVKLFVKSAEVIQAKQQKKSAKISFDTSFLSKYTNAQLFILLFLIVAVLAVIGTFLMFLLIG
jgi:hypothetical protein